MRKKECEKCKKDFRIMFRVQYTTEKKCENEDNS